MSATPTTYVVDTSTVIYDPYVFFAYNDASFIIPVTVVRELDNIKEYSSHRGAQAREVFRILDNLREQNHLDGDNTNYSNGVPTGLGGTIRIELNHIDVNSPNLYPEHYTIHDNDDTILVVARNLCLEKIATNTPNAFHNVPINLIDEQVEQQNITVMTQDVSMSIRADILHVPTRRHTVEKQDFTLPGGVEYIDLSHDCLNVDECYDHADENIVSDLFSHDSVELSDYTHDYGIRALDVNTGVVLRSGSSSVLAIYDGDNRLYKVRDYDFGLLSPKGAEQKIACELMSGYNRPAYTPQEKNSKGNEFLCSLSGRAGSGKTTIALMNAIYGVQQGDYSKIIVFRPTVNMSKNSDLGFLPGNLDEKMEPWTQAVKDVLSSMGIVYSGGDKKNSTEVSFNNHYSVDIDDVLSVEPVNYLRGRTFKNTFIIVDEAQNLEPHELMTIVTRLGYGSSLVMTWDDNQVDNTFVKNTVAEAPMLVLQNIMPDSHVFHINLPNNERGGISSLFN